MEKLGHKLFRREDVTRLLRGDDVSDIQALRRQGLAISQISALTGFNRRTIRKYLAQPGIPQYGPRPAPPGKLDPFKPYLEQRLAAGVWNAVVLLREIRERGYTGGYSILKEYIHPKRLSANTQAVRRFETPPGHQAQVDWGDVGTVEVDGQKHKLSGFVFTLGYSRAIFADIATDQSLLTLLRMHEEAFRQLGGVPAEILYDQMKTVVLDIDARQEIVWHPVFLDFARYWGFRPRLCHAYRPQTKGKVESGIRYLRSNFLCGRQASGVDDLRAQLRGWVSQIANRRVHGTTHQVVLDAWQQERLHLQPVAARSPYPYLPEQTRRVTRDAYVAYQTNRYSVPWFSAGQEVSVREVDGQVQIWRGGEQIAVHALCLSRYQTLTNPAHHADIPLSSSGRPQGKAKVTIRADEPQVEVRSLAVYEEVCLASEEGRAVA